MCVSNVSWVFFSWSFLFNDEQFSERSKSVSCEWIFSRLSGEAADESARILLSCDLKLCTCVQSASAGVAVARSARETRTVITRPSCEVIKKVNPS